MKYPKGVSGNPKGRPKGESDFKKACKKAANGCLDRIIEVAENSNHEDHLKANIWICEQGWGKAAQAVDVQGDLGVTFKVNVTKAT